MSYINLRIAVFWQISVLDVKTKKKKKMDTEMLSNSVGMSQKYEKHSASFFNDILKIAVKTFSRMLPNIPFPKSS